MHNLTEFLARYKHWFLFVFLEVTSVVLLFRFNDYQGSVWFTSANLVTGKVYELSSGLTSFFTMGKQNEQLTERNILLEQQINELNKKLYEKTRDPQYLKRGQYRTLSAFRLIPAKVVSNSLDRDDNLITINKGSWDGVRKDMGVVCGNGIVGTVYFVGIRYSVVIPVLNSKSNISCAIAGRDYFGYLRWSGGRSDVAYLDEVPRHARFKLGDRIVTSGYSSIFPPGVLVGKVQHVYNSQDGLSFRIAVKLSTDFGTLRDVCVVDAAAAIEQRRVMQSARDSMKNLTQDAATAE